MQATQLKLIAFGPGVWHCDSGPNTYRITQKGGPGTGYSCTCPARVECKHIKFLKTGKQPKPTTKQMAMQVQPATIDRPNIAPRPVDAITQIQSLKDELLPLLYGFKDEASQNGIVEIDRLKLELSRVLRLGFGRDRTLVFLNDKYGCLWYTMDGDDHRPIKEPFLYGYLRKIEFKEREKGKRPSHHLHLTVEADRLYVLVTGYDNHFSKGLMAAITQASPEQLSQPFWIQPQKTDTTTLCNLHQNGYLIRGRYSKDDSRNNWKAIAYQAMKKLQEANHEN